MARPRGGESDLQKILTEAAEICALSFGVPYAKICGYRADRNDLLVEAGYGWTEGVVGYVVSPADESSTQGRAYLTGKTGDPRRPFEERQLCASTFLRGSQDRRDSGCSDQR